MLTLFPASWAMKAGARLTTERVALAVDDEELVCHLTARILSDAGFRVIEAHSGDEAIALLGTLAPDGIDLVVSDIAMPGMTGVQLAAKIATQWPAVPVLLVSGHGGPDSGYQGSFLPKPFTPEALLSAVSALLPKSAHIA